MASKPQAKVEVKDTSAVEIIEAQKAMLDQMKQEIELLKAAVISAKASEAGTELNPKHITFNVVNGTQPFRGLVR